MKKLLLVANNGGHLLQLSHLGDVWGCYEKVWVTGDKEDARVLLNGEKIYHAHFPTDRNPGNLVRNFILALRIIRKEKPDWIVSTGAAMAVPFCYAAKLCGKSVMYIESFAKITSPTLSGRLVYPIATAFFVQWEELKPVYPKALYAGTVYDDILNRRPA